MEGMCRVCLDENIQLESIANTKLQDIYQKLTSFPLKAETPISLSVCPTCLVYLRKAYKLMVTCLRAEQYLACIAYDTDQKLTKPILTDTVPKLSRSILEHTNVAPADGIDIKQEAWDYKAVCKEEPVWDNNNDVCERVHSANEDIHDLVLDVKNIDIFEDFEENYHLFNQTDGNKENIFNGPSTIENDWKLQNCVVKLENLDKDIPKSTNEEEICVPHEQYDENEKLPNKKKNNGHFPVNTVEKPYKCDYCERSFTHKGHLKLHIPSHDVEKPLKCDVCHKSFTLHINLKKHMIVHTGERPYKCGICQKTFARKDYHKNHMLTHRNVRPHKCHLCKKSFVEKRNLIGHIRCHTGDRPYECDLCHTKFVGKKQLSRHIVETHSENKKQNSCISVKKYICDICKKSFAFKYSLEIHIRSHTNQKSFSCDICRKSYTQKKSLNTHMHTHKKPYKCDICKTLFARKYSLAKHIETKHETQTEPNTKQKEKCSYKCDICERTFTRMGSLNNHMMIHTGMRPFSCDTCQKSFIHLYQLKYHIRTHSRS